MRKTALSLLCALLLAGCASNGQGPGLLTKTLGLAFIGIHEIGGSHQGTVRTCTDDGCSRSSVYKRGDTYTVHTYD